MINLEKIRARYLQDPIPIRLGGLAANLSRVAGFAKHPGHQDVVLSVLQESKLFIEWTATQLELDQTAELVGLQVQLALWDLQSRQQWQDENWRMTLADKARQWSERVLDMSGLIPDKP